jgi:tetratricopeptide (TPR) repeat protein
MKTIFGEKDRLLRQAQSQISKNQFKEAEDLLLQYMSASPDHFGQLYLALAIHQQSRTDEALGILQDIIKQSPKEPEVFHYFRALLFFDINQFNKCQTELNKIKAKNHFHEALLTISEIFKEFSGNSKNYQNFYDKFKKYSAVSIDLQARILFKLESYLPVNLSKRAHPNNLPSHWRPIIFSKRRTQEKSQKLQDLLTQTIQSAQKKEYSLATEMLESCMAMEINNAEVEKTRLQISELLINNKEEALTQIGPQEIAWAYFYTQQFQKGIDFCTPLMVPNESKITNTFYLDLLDVLAYLHFCLGNFLVAEKYLETKMKLDAKDSEQASYYYAACLQHSKKNYEAINAYKTFIENSLDGYLLQLNCAMKTIAPDLIIN